jgi:O-antigen/teichoic acid export membrane protein
MILSYNGEKMLGLYTVGYNLPMYIADIITFSITYTIVPLFVEVYEQSGKMETEVLLEKIMHYLIIAVIPIAVGYCAVSEELITVFASIKYKEAAIFSPVILIATFFLGFNNVFNAGLYVKRESAKILMIMAVAVIVNIGLNILLLPRYAATGAAIATLVACVFSTLLTIFFSFRHIVVRLHFKTLLGHFVLSGIMFVAVKIITIDCLWQDLLVEIFIGIAIIILGNFIIERELFLMFLRRLHFIH